MKNLETGLTEYSNLIKQLSDKYVELQNMFEGDIISLLDNGETNKAETFKTYIEKLTTILEKKGDGELQDTTHDIVSEAIYNLYDIREDDEEILSEFEEIVDSNPIWVDEQMNQIVIENLLFEMLKETK